LRAAAPRFPGGLRGNGSAMRLMFALYLGVIVAGLVLYTIIGLAHN
jgi:hypothetical protein